jgi:hypothetical protein
MRWSQTPGGPVLISLAILPTETKRASILNDDKKLTSSNYLEKNLEIIISPTISSRPGLLGGISNPAVVVLVPISFP